MGFLEAIGFFFFSTVSIFTIVNPFGSAAVFLNLTSEESAKEKRRIALDACKTALIILLIFAISGFILFQLFGFTIGAFKIMGGLFLFRVAWLMLQGESKDVHPSHTRHDVTVVPLAIPLIAGPGTIVTTVVLFSEASTLLEHVLLLVSIIIVMILTFLVLNNSRVILRVFREKGVRVINKLMGLILGSISVQFIINGLSDVMPLILNATA